ncbi:MAG: hypothetical protein HY748_10955 [Elusimicrobia bacterium]|nr:hypothetical protein [Elusimicrobiota bacterium]
MLRVRKAVLAVPAVVFNAAYGIDDPRDDHVPNLGRTMNQRVMGNKFPFKFARS